MGGRRSLKLSEAAGDIGIRLATSLRDGNERRGTSLSSERVHNILAIEEVMIKSATL
jgi:hypothetical protein